MAVTRKNVVEIVIQGTDLSAAAFRDATGNLKTMRADLEQIGRTSTRVGAAIQAAVVPSVVSFAREQRELNQAIVSGSEGGNIEAIRADVQRVQAEVVQLTGKARSDIARAIRTAMREGIDVRDTGFGKFLTDASELATTEGASIEEAVRTMADGLQAFNLETRESALAADVSFAIARRTASGLEQVGDLYRQAGPLARSYRVELRDLAAVTAALGEANIKGGAAAAGLQQIMSKLLTPTEQARTVLDGLGVQLSDTEGNARPLIDVLIDLQSATTGMSDSQRRSTIEAITGDRAMVSLGAALSANLRAVREWAQELGDGRQRQEALRVATSGLAAEYGRTKSEVSSLAGEIGETLEPVVIDLLKNVRDIARDTREWAGSNEAAVQTVAQLGAEALVLGQVFKILADVSKLLGVRGIFVVSGIAAARTIDVYIQKLQEAQRVEKNIGGGISADPFPEFVGPEQGEAETHARETAEKMRDAARRTLPWFHAIEIVKALSAGEFERALQLWLGPLGRKVVDFWKPLIPVHEAVDSVKEETGSLVDQITTNIPRTTRTWDEARAAVAEMAGEIGRANTAVQAGQSARDAWREFLRESRNLTVPTFDDAEAQKLREFLALRPDVQSMLDGIARGFKDNPPPMPVEPKLAPGWERSLQLEIDQSDPLSFPIGLPDEANMREAIELLRAQLRREQEKLARDLRATTGIGPLIEIPRAEIRARLGEIEDDLGRLDRAAGVDLRIEGDELLLLRVQGLAAEIERIKDSIPDLKIETDTKDAESGLKELGASGQEAATVIQGAFQGMFQSILSGSGNLASVLSSVLIGAASSILSRFITFSIFPGLGAAHGGVVSTAHAAHGGVLRGAGSPGRDSVMTWAAPGEAYLDTNLTDRMARFLDAQEAGVGPSGGAGDTMVFQMWGVPSSPVELRRLARSVAGAKREVARGGSVRQGPPRISQPGGGY